MIQYDDRIQSERTSYLYYRKWRRYSARPQCILVECGPLTFTSASSSVKKLNIKSLNDREIYTGRKAVLFKDCAPRGFPEDNFVKGLQLQLKRYAYNRLFTTKECSYSQGRCSMDSVKLSPSQTESQVDPS